MYNNTVITDLLDALDGLVATRVDLAETEDLEYTELWRVEEHLRIAIEKLKVKLPLAELSNVNNKLALISRKRG